MRLSLLLLTYLLVAISPEPACRQKKNSDSIERILLTEFTRGTQRSIEVTPKQTTVRINDAEETAPTPAASWQSLTRQIGDLPLASLPKIPIVSKKHQADAALHATLTIVARDSAYTSDTFDHNAPPVQLQPIVDSLYGRIPASLRERFQR